MPTAISTNNSMLRKHCRAYAPYFVIALIAGIFWALNFMFEGRLLTPSNVKAVLSHAIVPAFVAWGFSFIFACGFIDLSVGSVIVLSANMAGTLGNQFGYAGVILGGIGTGVILLCVNFNVYIYTKIPSWIAGLGMAMIYEAAAVFYSRARMAKGLSVVNLDENFRGLGQVPGIFIVFAVGLVSVYFLYNRTTIGLNIRALGSNVDVSKAMGINVNKTLLMVGIISGLAIGCASFVQESYSVRMTAKTGLTSLSLIFQPLATYLLAQSIQSKINLMIGIPICAVIIHSIFNILTIAGVPSGTWQEAILGMSVILFGVISQRNVKGVVK